MSSWAEILGHSAEISQLKKIITAEKFPHAIIFSGAEGIGKKKIAETCAAALLCENPEGGEPCGVCQNCKLISAGSHPDFYLVEPEITTATRNIKIGQIRTLQAEVILRPVQAERRVVILDGAEFMNNAAANCLLKTLEDPPSQTIFILISANRAGLLMTVRSRCRTMNFDKLTAAEIFSELTRRKIEPDKAKKISIVADGSLGRALILAESGGYEVRESALDLVERIALKNFDNEDIFTKGAQVESWSRENFADFVIYIQKILRDIYLHGDFELYNPDFAERLSQIKIPAEKISEMIELGVEVRRRLNSNANLRLLAESYLMQLKLIFRR